MLLEINRVPIAYPPQSKQLKQEGKLASKKKLPSFEQLSESFKDSTIPSRMRNDSEISEWLIGIFKMRDLGELHIKNTDISRELSLFTGMPITGDHISRAYGRWKTKGKL